MKFEPTILKNGCTTTLNFGPAILKKEKIVEFNNIEFQVSVGVGDKAIGNVSTYLIDGNKKIKISVWWTKDMELHDSIKYFHTLDSKHEYKHITTLPKKYKAIYEEILNVVKKLKEL